MRAKRDIRLTSLALNIDNLPTNSIATNDIVEVVKIYEISKCFKYEISDKNTF